MNTSLIKNSIPVYPNWPKKGVNYMNTVELCKNPKAFAASIDWFCDLATSHSVTDIFAADARGFIWAAATAIRLNLPLHTVRKKGKMPGNLWQQSYQLEYGTDTLELSKNIDPGDRSVLIVDDVLATGGTAEAIVKLISNLGVSYKNITLGVVVNLSFLGGDKVVMNHGCNVKGIINE